MVRLGAPMGSGNFVCTDPEDVERLVELPNKVRRNTFAARGESQPPALTTLTHRHVCVRTAV